MEFSIACQPFRTTLRNRLMAETKSAESGIVSGAGEVAERPKATVLKTVEG
jgi:hypothetical protein